MRRIEYALTSFKYGLGLLLLAGVGLNFANVCLRYFLGGALPWTEEVMTFGMLFIVMAGTVIATARDENLKIDILLPILPVRVKTSLLILSHLVWMVVSIYLATQSLKVVEMLMRFGQTSTAARIPSWIPHSFVLGAFILSALAALYAIFRELWPSDDRSESPDHAAAVGFAGDND